MNLWSCDMNKDDCLEKIAGVFLDIIWGHDKYDDIKMNDKYDFHSAQNGLFNGKVFKVRVCGLFDGEVKLVGEATLSCNHPVDEFRELIKKGVYVKVNK